MNVTATGTSSLASLYLQQLLGTSTTSALSDSSTGSASVSDLLTLSSAGQQASASQGADPFQADLTALKDTIASGDLATAKQQYEAMLEKMKQHGQVPSDFTAIGTALDAGDLTTAGKAVSTVQSDTAKGPQGSNPLQNDMNQLGALIQSGDLTDAQTLFASILAKVSPSSTTTSTTAATSAAATASTTSASTGGDTLTTTAAALEKALASGDSSTSTTAFTALMAQLQAQAGDASGTVRSMESVASAAYLATAAATV